MPGSRDVSPGLKLGPVVPTLDPSVFASISSLRLQPPGHQGVNMDSIYFSAFRKQSFQMHEKGVGVCGRTQISEAQ